MPSPTLRAPAWNPAVATTRCVTPGAPPAAWVKLRRSIIYMEHEDIMAVIDAPRAYQEDIPSGIITYLDKVLAITTVEVQKLRHDQWDVITRSVQPVLWLLLF